MLIQNRAEIEFLEFEPTEELHGCDEIAPFTEAMYANLRKMLRIPLSLEFKMTPKGRSWLYDWWQQQVRNDERKEVDE